MKRRNLIKAGVFIPPVVFSLKASPAFARPGSVFTPKLDPEGIPPKIQEKYIRRTNVFREIDWKINDWEKIQIEQNKFSFRRIWTRLVSLFGH
jgi:hypothetical protein